MMLVGWAISTFRRSSKVIFLDVITGHQLAYSIQSNFFKDFRITTKYDVPARILKPDK
jgi:hypothetical protein